MLALASTAILVNAYSNLIPYTDFNKPASERVTYTLDKTYTDGIKLIFTNWVVWNRSDSAAAGHIWIPDAEGSGRIWDLQWKQDGTFCVWYDSGSGTIKLAEMTRTSGWASDGTEKIIFEMTKDKVVVKFQNTTKESEAITVLEAGFDAYPVDCIYVYGDTPTTAESGYMDVETAVGLALASEEITEMFMAIVPVFVIIAVIGMIFSYAGKLGR